MTYTKLSMVAWMAVIEVAPSPSNAQSIAQSLPGPITSTRASTALPSGAGGASRSAKFWIQTSPSIANSGPGEKTTQALGSRASSAMS